MVATPPPASPVDIHGLSSAGSVRGLLWPSKQIVSNQMVKMPGPLFLLTPPIDPLFMSQCLASACFLGALISLWQYHCHGDLQLYRLAAPLILAATCAGSLVLHLTATAYGETALTACIGIAAAAFFQCRTCKAKEADRNKAVSLETVKGFSYNGLDATASLTSDYSRS